jgi:hypothetical protein
MPESIPVNPPIPGTPTYGLAALYTVKEFKTRDEYRAAFNEEPPMFNPALPPKLWFDTSGGVPRYNVWNQTKAAFFPICLSPAFAKAVNLPGAMIYPVRVVPPTTAVAVVPAGTPPQAVNVEYLSSKEEANQLSVELGMSVGESSPTPYGVIWNEETRRCYDVDGHNCGLLMKDKCQNGVGAPGHWTIQDQTNPKWVPDPEPTPDPHIMPVPVPCRPLDLTKEELIVGIGGIPTFVKI